MSTSRLTPLKKFLLDVTHLYQRSFESLKHGCKSIFRIVSSFNDAFLVSSMPQNEGPLTLFSIFNFGNRKSLRRPCPACGSWAIIAMSFLSVIHDQAVKCYVGVIALCFITNSRVIAATLSTNGVASLVVIPALCR